MTPGSAGFRAVTDAASALAAGGIEYWCFGGWAVDLWVGHQTRDHDDIDLMVWRSDEPRIHEALTAAGWQHSPSPEDLVGTDYVKDGTRIQLTFAVSDGGRMVVPVPDQSLVVSEGPLDFAVRESGGVTVRVVPLPMLSGMKAVPRPDEVGGAKDRADLAALRTLADEGP